MKARGPRLIILVAAVLAACGGSEVDRAGTGGLRQSPRETAGPGGASSIPDVARASPSPTREPGGGELQVDGFAKVVADRLQVRVGPGLGYDTMETDCYGHPVPGCPPLTLGRDDSPWRLTLVFLLDGPVESDGYDWYLIATESLGTLYWDNVGWVAAGDAEDRWLVPRDVSCPHEPVELGQVTFTAHSPLTLLHCLGGRELTLRGYYTDPPPDGSAEGSCLGEPAPACARGGHMLRTEEGSWYGEGDHLQLYVHPAMGPMPPRPGWIEVTGTFDHPDAAEWCDGQPASDLFCRVAFVVTSASSVLEP